MTMFERVCAKSDVWPGEMLGVVVKGRRVLVVCPRDGEPRAYEDRCAHQNMPLSDGHFDGRVLVCRYHEWSYDACTGCGINPENARLRSLPLRVEGGDILVDVTPAERVGPVLHAGPRASAVVAAIRGLNEGVEVVDRGGYVLVLVPGRCRLTRAAVERELGAPFELPGDLEKVMTSFKGRFELSESEASWWSP
jgi:toluene monooxygenase system ferredoxin subunit